MSNTKLKEQIEAAKIALVHSAELATPLDPTQQSATITQISNSDQNNAVDDSNRAADAVILGAAGSPERTGENMVPHSDFSILEARLEDLQTQIKNQQRDLHTLLQKLRDITAKSKPHTEPKKRKYANTWIFALLFFGGSFAATYFALGGDTMMRTIYTGIGQAVALIDALFNKL